MTIAGRFTTQEPTPVSCLRGNLFGIIITDHHHHIMIVYFFLEAISDTTSKVAKAISRVFCSLPPLRIDIKLNSNVYVFTLNVNLKANLQSTRFVQRNNVRFARMSLKKDHRTIVCFLKKKIKYLS